VYLEISNGISVWFKRSVVRFGCISGNPLCEYPNRDGEVGGDWGRCQLVGREVVRRFCGTEWLIVASRHPRVLVEWIKGWKKEWKPFHAFTDQSQDHVFRAIPSPLGTRDMHHPAIHFYFPDLCVCSCRCRGDLQTLRKGKAPHAVYRSRDTICRWYQFSKAFAFGIKHSSD